MIKRGLFIFIIRIGGLVAVVSWKKSLDARRALVPLVGCRAWKGYRRGFKPATRFRNGVKRQKTDTRHVMCLLLLQYCQVLYFCHTFDANLRDQNSNDDYFALCHVTSRKSN